MKLIVDATVALAASATPVGFERFRGFELHAPALLWIEATSAVHAMRWRGDVDKVHAELMRDRILDARIREIHDHALTVEAWQLADEFGWAKIYDAHYVSLARRLGCRVMTLDARLRRGAARLGFVVGPTEL